MKYYGFIYITTNAINGKKYIGQCRCGKANVDTYLGSGKLLTEAIKKYGKENFSREILQYAESREELSVLEIKFITDHNAVNDHMYYNIAPGGYTTRGFAGKSHTLEAKEKIRSKCQDREITQKIKDTARELGKKNGRIPWH